MKMPCGQAEVSISFPKHIDRQREARWEGGLPCVSMQWNMGRMSRGVSILSIRACSCHPHDSPLLAEAACCDIPRAVKLKGKACTPVHPLRQAHRVTFRPTHIRHPITSTSCVHNLNRSVPLRWIRGFLHLPLALPHPSQPSASAVWSRRQQLLVNQVVVVVVVFSLCLTSSEFEVKSLHLTRSSSPIPMADIPPPGVHLPEGRRSDHEKSHKAVRPSLLVCCLNGNSNEVELALDFIKVDASSRHCPFEDLMAHKASTVAVSRELCMFHSWAMRAFPLQICSWQYPHQLLPAFSSSFAEGGSGVLAICSALRGRGAARGAGVEPDGRRCPQSRQISLSHSPCCP